VCIPLGIFIIRIIDRNNTKLRDAARTQQIQLENERSEQMERYKRDAQRRLDEIREEQIAKGMHIPVSNDPELNKLIEHGWKNRFKDYKGSVDTTKVIKKEIPAEKSLKPQKIFEEKVSTKIDYDQDKIMHNASIRRLYYAIKDTLFGSDTIEIKSYQGLDYLAMECNEICTSIVRLGGFKYLLIHAQSYNYRDNQNKDQADEKAFATFNRLKSTDSYTDKHPLLIKTKDTNGGYKVELHSTIQAYSDEQVQEIWSDFNYFSAQFVYHVVENH